VTLLDSVALSTALVLFVMTGVHLCRGQLMQGLFLEVQGLTLVFMIALKYLLIANQLENWEELSEYLNGTMVFSVPFFLAWGHVSTPDMMAACKRGFIWLKTCRYCSWLGWYTLLIWPLAMVRDLVKPPYPRLSRDDGRHNGTVSHC
jgi:hypothetical protein